MSKSTPSPEQQREIDELTADQRSVYEYAISIDASVDDALDAAHVQYPTKPRPTRRRRTRTPKRDGHFTPTETTLRLRALAAEARSRCRLPKNARIEIGTRAVPVVTLDDPQLVEWYADDDDLVDMLDLRQARSDDTVTAHGSIVHLYFSIRESVTDDYFELSDICVGWMGTPDKPAQLLDTNGTPIVRD